MVKNGRTMAEAIAAGTYYEISRGTGIYASPACETPREVVDCALRIFSDIKPGDVFKVTRIIGGSIGCRVVEDCGEIVA